MPGSSALREDPSRTDSRLQRNRNSHGDRQDASPCTFWFTGLSGAGKSTLAGELAVVLDDLDLRHHVLDGDLVRVGLCSDLAFSEADRAENIRRIAEVAHLFNQAGLHAIVAVISPFQAHRDTARRIIGVERFVEIHVDTGLATCIERDPKGLYAKACSGRLPNFTGISAAYERPTDPDLVIDTAGRSVAECRAVLKRFTRSLIVRRSLPALRSA